MGTLASNKGDVSLEVLGGHKDNGFSYIVIHPCVTSFAPMQVKSGTIFDNILITDDEKYAETFGEETWGETKGPEKSMKDKVQMVQL
jgi:hypothetical protein